MSELTVSVVICAYTENRWAETLAAVDSVRQQTVPAREIILVVDHNPALYARLCAALPGVTVVENRSHRGLSGGKNTGVALASGDIVAFLDDDATADPDWLKYLVAGYSDRVVAGVGGLTLPNWQTRRPRWFPEEFDWTVGCTYIGMPIVPSPVRNLMGGNASFRREVFDIAGGFDTGIGRSAAKRPLGGEETEFCIRLRQRLPDAVLLFDNRAAIRHLVPAARCRFSYFRSRCFAEGFSKAQVTASVGVADGLSAERRYTYRTLPRGFVHGVRDAVHGDPWGIARAGAIVAGLSAAAGGYLLGCLRRDRRRQQPAGALAGQADSRAA
jgi:glucosyl-dolichyl phosphate glucuronosyltransferase